MFKLPRSPLSIAAACAALYAISLSPGASAQDPTPTATGTPQETATPLSSPTGTPTSTATASPTAEATQTVQPAATPEDVPPEPAEAYETPVPAETIASPTPTSEPSLGAEEGKERSARRHRAAQRAARRAARRMRAAADACDPDKIQVRDGALVTTLEEEGAGIGEDEGSTEASECAPDVEVLPAGIDPEPMSRPDGAPTPANPGYALATPGAAPIGVPNFFIDKFRIPPFLLPIYQAAGMEYGIRWEVLAAINEIETDYGRNLNVSSAGALGWMQFMPPTWEAYGTDANKDGVKDPYNPVDAIFAAARYLKAAGADTDLYKAIFAYNRADWYVESVLMRARVIGGLPSNFVGSLTGLTQARFPVHARATYAGAVKEGREVKAGNAAFPVESDEAKRDIEIYTRRGAPAIAVNDAKVVAMGRSARLGRYVQIQDVYGNTYTYARLASVAKTYPAPRERAGARVPDSELPARDAAPTSAASATTKASRLAQAAARSTGDAAAAAEATPEQPESRTATLPDAAPVKERLFANPARARAREAGGEVQLAEAGYEPDAGSPLQLNRQDYDAKPLRKGARVIAGTTLGRIGATVEGKAPHLLFEIRPAGRGAPRIDPKPILDGWKLLESTAIYRAAGKNPFFGADAEQPSIGQILLMSKEALQRRVLNSPRIDIYGCGRQDVRIGAIDRRVLATLEFLAASGLRPTVTSLKCGHSYLTASGNVSQHSSGNAVDIAAINGINILGNQGEGTVTDVTIQRLLTLQGTMKPDQIISLMTFEGTDNTYAMGDHNDHIHIGWRPLYGTNSKAAKQVNAILKPDQWIKLIDRLNAIDNPAVATTPSKYAVKAVKRASTAHRGE